METYYFLTRAHLHPHLHGITNANTRGITNLWKKHHHKFLYADWAFGNLVSVRREQYQVFSTRITALTRNPSTLPPPLLMVFHKGEYVHGESAFARMRFSYSWFLYCVLISSDKGETKFVCFLGATGSISSYIFCDLESVVRLIFSINPFFEYDLEKCFVFLLHW